MSLNKIGYVSYRKDGIDRNGVPFALPIASAITLSGCVKKTKAYLWDAVWAERPFQDFVVMKEGVIMFDSSKDSLKRVVLFDLDGTLANITERQMWLRQTPKNWDAFAMGVKNDLPVMPVIKMNNLLKNAGYYIIIVSGRDSGPKGVYRDESIEWLNENGVRYDEIYMRQHKDYTPDQELKRNWLKEIRNRLGEPEFVFDDRPKVCRMWVEEGVFVFDVSQGKGEF